MKYYIYRVFVNNFFSNFFIRLFRLENIVYRKLNPYLSFKINKTKTVQENAGYSERSEINEVLLKSKKDLLSTVNNYCKNGHILDIGCGPGMYLSLFRDSGFKLSALDINSNMLIEAKNNVPEATYYHGDYLTTVVPEKVDFIYCIGVLIYIGRGQMDLFFKKIHDQMNKDGILYLNYPHAISLADLLYNDLSYIQYSPSVVERLIAPYFEIIVHHHAFDNRVIKNYDKTPYKSLNPDTNRTYKNSYLLVAKKKNL